MDTSKSRISITLGESAENHVGMEMLGGRLADRGFNSSELSRIGEYFQGCEVIHSYLNDPRHTGTLTNNVGVHQQLPHASVLIIRGGFNFLMSELEFASKLTFANMIKLDWDRQYWDNRRGKILNKHTRANLCFSDASQEPDYENRKGRVVAYDEVTLLKHWRLRVMDMLKETIGLDEPLQTEGNLYDDVNVNGIGFHGDGERKRIICGSFGASSELHWQWYIASVPIGERIKFVLNDGDMYIMSEKASGWDWKRKSTPTLRHAAGGPKYLYPK